MGKKNKSFKRCGDCIHLSACSSWNIGNLGGMCNTDATHCVNYETTKSVIENECKLSAILSLSDFATLAICAIRYCHGRMSYMPDLVRGIVRPYLGRISDKDLNIMLADCEFQRQTEMYGDERIDKPAWLKWHEELKAEKERRKNEE